MGTIVTNDLKWDQNTDNIVKKAFARMEQLRKLSMFGAPIADLKKVSITFIRSHCEQSCYGIVVWQSKIRKTLKESKIVVTIHNTQYRYSQLQLQHCPSWRYGKILPSRSVDHTIFCAQFEWAQRRMSYDLFWLSKLTSIGTKGRGIVIFTVCGETKKND